MYDDESAAWKGAMLGSAPLADKGVSAADAAALGTHELPSS